MSDLPHAQLDWNDQGQPLSRQFGDVYFSRDDGLGETRHVFLAGNDLPARFAALPAGARLVICETGFGTGLNLLALAQVATMPVRFTSFEAFPMSGDELARAHAAFPELADLAAQLRAGWPARRFTVGQVSAEVVEADARTALPAWAGQADADRKSVV